MAFVIPNALFLHIPKTGGVWIRHAIERLGIENHGYLGQHEYFPRLYLYCPRELFDNIKISVFVRHPITWYQSIWMFHMQHGWQSDVLLNVGFASNDFHGYLRNVLRHYRKIGFMNTIRRMYIEWIDDKHKPFVGYTENLVDDFVKFMGMAGYELDIDVVKSFGRSNKSMLDGRDGKYWAKYSSALYDDVMDMEWEFITDYYHNYELNKEDFVGDLPY